MLGFHKARFVAVGSGLSINLILSDACLAQSASECEKRAASIYKEGGENKYSVGVAFSSSLTGSEKAVSEFYKRAFKARYWSITRCGFYVNADDMSRLPNFEPRACDKNLGSDGPLFLRSAIIQSRSEFNRLVRETCKLETADFKMTKFGLLVANPKPSIMFGPAPSKSLK